MSLRAVLLVVALMALTVEGKGRKTAKVLPFRHLFDKLDFDTKWKLSNFCNNAVVMKYPWGVPDGDEITRGANSEHESLFEGRLLLSTGCYLKKLFIDKKGYNPKGLTTAQKKAMKFYSECAAKYYKSSKGDFESFGRIVNDAGWCGSKSPENLLMVSYEVTARHS